VSVWPPLADWPWVAIAHSLQLTFAVIAVFARYRAAGCLHVQLHILTVWHHIKNRTPSIDACLLWMQFKSSQVSCIPPRWVAIWSVPDPKIDELSSDL